MRNYLITGISSGIGRAIGMGLLTQGHQVLGVSRRTANIEHERFSFESVDLAQLETLPQTALQLWDAYGPFDGVVCAAGMGHFAHLEQFSHRAMHAVMDINFFSPLYLVHALLPKLKRQSHADVLLIGSEAAMQGKKMGSIYCASKFALRGLGQALREECASSSVRVLMLHPGMTRTPFFDDLGFAPGEEADQALEAEDVAEAALMMLSMRPGALCDELHLQPHKKVIRKVEIEKKLGRE